MIAYNKSWLGNLMVRNEAAQAFKRSFLTKEEFENIHNKYTAPFYTPNLFIRIGLFFLTIVVLLFSFALIVLILMDNVEKILAGIAVFFALLGYAALEMMIHKKNHYQSGVDDALLWTASVSFFCAISFQYNFGNLANSLLIFMISLYGTLRYADRLMAVAAYISFLGIVFFAFVQTGPYARLVVPFIIMMTSGATYFLIKRSMAKTSWSVYQDCLVLVEIASLISLYAAGNYWVVRELSIIMFHLNLQPGQSIPFGWIFWIFTIAIPLVYVFRGLQKKDAILIRTGLLLVVALVVTVRYYNSVMSIEAAMAIGGIIMILIARLAIHFLQKPKHGFTYEEDDSDTNADKLNLESLVIAETFTELPGATEERRFGGGSFGGGGSSGDF